MADALALMHPLLSHGLLLRPFEQHDAEPFASAARESVATVGRWMPWCHREYSAVQAREWFTVCSRGFADKSAFEVGVFSADGTELLGGAGLNQFNKQHNFCNLGYWVRESRQRQGIASRAVRILADFAFTELALTRIEIVIAEGNERSDGVARKAGAQFECLARNRLIIDGAAIGASVYSLVPAHKTASNPSSVAAHLTR